VGACIGRRILDNNGDLKIFYNVIDLFPSFVVIDLVDFLSIQIELE